MCRSRVLCVAEKADARAARTVVSFAVRTLAFVPTSVSDRSLQGGHVFVDESKKRDYLLVARL
jgi:hypothetical protein